MNQEKIGKFLADVRKEKGLTQQELAKIVGVTDRAISNWENGRRMPDISLFKVLCEALDISLNELLAGEKILVEEKEKRSEEILLKTLTKEERNKKRLQKSFYLLGISVFLLILIIFFIYKTMYPNIDIYKVDFNYLDQDELSKVFEKDNVAIYYYGVSDLFLCNQKNRCFDFVSALKNKQTSILNMHEYWQGEHARTVQTSYLYDGGTTIYYNDNYAAIFCNTREGNKDIYFGKSEMLDDLDGAYCGHEKSPLKKFRRTYDILAIKKKDEANVFLTLENNQGEKATVSLVNTSDLQVGQKYEFTFYTFESFEDTITNIFAKAIYVGHKKIDKISHEERNDKIVISDKISTPSSLNELENVVMEIVEGTLTREGAKILITDLSGQNYTYGSEFWLEKQDGSLWQTLSPIHDDYFWNDIAYHVDINNKLMLETNWEYMYGKLDNGKYRLVKKVLEEDTPKYISVVFEIK